MITLKRIFSRIKDKNSQHGKVQKNYLLLILNVYFVFAFPLCLYESNMVSRNMQQTAFCENNFLIN